MNPDQPSSSQKTTDRPRNGPYGMRVPQAPLRAKISVTPRTEPRIAEHGRVNEIDMLPRNEQIAATSLTSPMPIASFLKRTVPSQATPSSTSAPKIALARLHEKPSSTVFWPMSD